MLFLLSKIVFCGVQKQKGKHIFRKIDIFHVCQIVSSVAQKLNIADFRTSELQLNKANTSDTEAAFLDLHLSISNDIVPKFLINMTTLISKLSISHF